MENIQPLELLRQARGRFTQREIAKHIGKTAKTVRRWETGETPCPPLLEPALRALLQRAAHRPASGGRFRFIDLFAGIGGIRMGFEAHGGECVFTSEWNDFSKKTYLENFGDQHAFVGDIVPFPAEEVPDHDVLLAGFPCQPFSIAGVSKKNSLGRPHGFECTTQGTLFFDVARIIAAKRPKAFLLENVKNLLSHDKGNTFRVILQTLRDELGYDVHYRVIDGQHFTPQHRERILIAGFREQTGFSWDNLQLPEKGAIRLAAILHRTDGTEPVLPWDGDRFFDHDARIVQPKYTLTPKLWSYLQAYAEKHRAAGNGFGFGLVTPDDVSRTLSARYYKDGSEILVSQGRRKRPRRLTPRECARLMGFPDDFRIPVSDTQAYRQFSDAAIPPMIKEVAKHMVKKISMQNTPVKTSIKISSDAFSPDGNWTREQSMLAFRFYCETPFGKLHSKNKQVILLANLIGRTPSAVARKCTNFASLDPRIVNSGRVGSAHCSKLDRQIWDEFHANWEELVDQCAALENHLRNEKNFIITPDDEDQVEYQDFTGEMRTAWTKQRIRQNFFRRSVLSNYGEKCCITGISDKRFLVASHIVAWREDKSNRLNPSNGLCLSSIHDKAFDSHLFSLSDDFRIILSNELKNTKDKFLQDIFWGLDGFQISLPDKFTPGQAFITRHRSHMESKQ